jgi:D-3-phosphoglycerate dehydrogenase
MAPKTSYPKEKLKIALLEKVHPAAVEVFERSGYLVEYSPDAPDEDALKELIKDAHIIGLRSRTKLRKEHLQSATRLLSVGCFSVGTDQVDLNTATSCGVPVFNAPFSSTRSVAELAIGNILALARRTFAKSAKLHNGEWDKSLAGATEVRGKTVGIIGYGHIGQQVGLLAEALGMNVAFYDLLKKLSLGRAYPVDTLEELVAKSDFVSLHIPQTKKTTDLVNAKLLSEFKNGACLINLSRGKVVDIAALVDALKSGKLSGVALDVFPEEPAQTIAEFESPLRGLDNVILTPHIGGSTEEAQYNIGVEVANSLIKFIELGSTEGAVNFPAVNLPHLAGTHRILNVHQNMPGALSEINQVISDLQANIEAQYLGTFRDIGYLIMDINKEVSQGVRSRLLELPKSIRTRILY